MSGPLLEARGLRRRLGGRAVLDGLDLHVQPGEVVGLLGPNGAGKTTCFRLLTGELSMEHGAVHLKGLRMDGMPLWRRVRAGLGYLPQGPSLFRALDARAHLELAGLGGAEAERAIVQAGLRDVAHVPAGRLSGGERRRLGIARCLAGSPSVVLLDEPFAGVDPVGVESLQLQVRALAHARGLGVLVTDHAVQATLPICDRAVILDAGSVLASGTPAEVARDPRVRGRYLGDSFSLGSVQGNGAS
ncbi:MAG: ATP-binding cassette domain-containing protein [Myxococcota bacterium]|nr:ATP-binding cassette domain-containing protein [Myxococcota bacterium]